MTCKKLSLNLLNFYKKMTHCSLRPGLSLKLKKKNKKIVRFFFHSKNISTNCSALFQLTHVGVAHVLVTYDMCIVCVLTVCLDCACLDFACVSFTCRPWHGICMYEFITHRDSARMFKLGVQNGTFTHFV